MTINNSRPFISSISREDAGGDQVCAEIDARRPVLVVFAHWNRVSEYTANIPRTSNPQVAFYDWGAPTRCADFDSDATMDELYYPPNAQTVNAACNWFSYVDCDGTDFVPDTPTLVTGHAVAGVGYAVDFDPDGAGPLPETDYLIVHDTLAGTPENVAVPWNDVSNPTRPANYWGTNAESWWISNVTVNPDAFPQQPGGNARLKGKIVQGWTAWNYWD